jgi:hypothetical protein
VKAKTSRLHTSMQRPQLVQAPAVITGVACGFLGFKAGGMTAGSGQTA